MSQPLEDEPHQLLLPINAVTGVLTVPPLLAMPDSGLGCTDLNSEPKPQEHGSTRRLKRRAIPGLKSPPCPAGYVRTRDLVRRAGFALKKCSTQPDIDSDAPTTSKMLHDDSQKVPPMYPGTHGITFPVELSDISSESHLSSTLCSHSDSLEDPAVLKQRRRRRKALQLLRDIHSLKSLTASLQSQHYKLSLSIAKADQENFQ
ncbi:hypothetical protein C8J57DRAFT_1481056 [Mycena rebaudengoi]|nr:hypothetical protein C8J57DRAFT_1481056 [Mycena rebaudengoi]